MRIATTILSCFNLLLLLISSPVVAQQKRSFSLADTLRGSITAERSWWDVLRYDINVQPDYQNKSIIGSNKITYKVIKDNAGTKMQIDLKEPLVIDSVVGKKGEKINYTKAGSVWYLNLPKAKSKSIYEVTIYYKGKVHEARRAPWDGGWTFTKDSLGRPWMTVTCQGAAGASIWYPCKDHQSDEPDKGASLAMRVPDSLMAVGNGRLKSTVVHGDGTTSYSWEVLSPINNYNIIPYIGQYVHFKETYKGEAGILDLDYWVLDYNEEKAKSYLPNEVSQMLKSFEYWFGPYPFYKDGYKIIDVPHTGMEHQSAVAYGNQYGPGYRHRDGSGTGWGMKWDFIVVHESGHEWFGNSITTNDLADMWVHEGFTNYSETLYVDYHFGKQAGNEYNAGIRRGIRNDRPIIPTYGVNDQGSGDMYAKASNMLHAIRNSLDDDKKFREILRGLNKKFYHSTVNSKQVEAYISKHASLDYSSVFDQYLRDTQIPKLEITIDTLSGLVKHRYTDCNPNFSMPIVLKNDTVKLAFVPTTQWASINLTPQQIKILSADAIRKLFYIDPIVTIKS